MDLDSPKWAAVMPVFDHFGADGVGQKFYDDAKTRMNFYSIEQLDQAATEYVNARSSAPMWWSHLAEFLPKRGEKKSGGKKADDGPKPEPCWWGVEGSWGGPWDKANGRDMEKPAADMLINTARLRPENYLRNRATEFYNLALQRGASQAAIDAIIQKDQERNKQNENI